MKDEFIEFLKKNHAWDEFKHNFKRNRNDSLDEWFNYSDRIILICAFPLHSTREGADFWIDIADKWTKIRDA